MSLLTNAFEIVSIARGGSCSDPSIEPNRMISQGAEPRSTASRSTPTPSIKPTFKQQETTK